MNKTVNINLGGTFFHIDEDAYSKLTRYLDAIRRSFKNPQGQDEIIKDIEARISELFSEKLDSSRQVITIKELDEVIAVMGQPEDYAVDEEIFDDAPAGGKSFEKKGPKKLFRDIDDKYLGGVASGMGHYMGVDAIWVRLIWILLAIISSGTFILIYIIFWILVPEAKTVADKLTMRGEPVNISNIEKKFKEGYDDIADKIKNADYDEYGKRIKSSSENFVDTLGKIIMTLLIILGKFIGVLIIIVAAVMLIGLFISLFITGVSGFFGGWYTELFHIVNDSIFPIWLVSILAFFAIGIPFFFLFILGLKILVSNLKSIGRIAKYTLLGIWLLSVMGLIVFGVIQASEQAFEGTSVTTERLDIRPTDTLYLSMGSNPHFERQVKRSSGLTVRHDANDQQVFYSNNIRLIVKSTKDSIASIAIDKKANGSEYKQAKERAEAIDHNYSFTNNRLVIDGYFLTDVAHKFRGQEMEVTLYLPIGTILNTDKNTYTFHRNTPRYGDILNNGDEEYYLEILDGKTLCLNCPAKETTRTSTNPEMKTVSWDDEVWDEEWKDGNKIKINREGIDINVTDTVDSVRVKINRNGIEVKSN